MNILNSWHRIAGSEAELFDGEKSIKEILIVGKRICIMKHAEKLYATTATCPHAGGTLADGYIDVLGNIVCPLHHYRFQLATGRNNSGEGYYLKTYSIEQRADGIYIGLSF